MLSRTAAVLAAMAGPHLVSGAAAHDSDGPSRGDEGSAIRRRSRSAAAARPATCPTTRSTDLTFALGVDGVLSDYPDTAVAAREAG
jgi:hypothetical protein